MAKATRINTEFNSSKNPLREVYFNLFLKHRKIFRTDYLSRFGISSKAFYHRLSGRDRLIKEEVKWITTWKLKK